MLKLTAILTLIAGGLLLSGCAGLFNPEFTPVAPQAIPDQQPMTVVTGSIYQADRDMRLFEDRTARRKGDIITIQLVERTDATKKASTSMDKGTEVELANPTLFGYPFSADRVTSVDNVTLETSISGNRAFAGAGESDQSNSLHGQISAVVVDVYPNGNLMIRGEKMLTLNQGKEFVQISGVVRPDDISPDNSVLSTQVADAQISYIGKGAIADANTIGWLARFFFTMVWPF
jgi:flagellar L-ring protein precursor FlgH